MRVAVDAMGGDNAPEPIVLGAIEGARRYNVEVILVGDESLIRPLLRADMDGSLRSRISVSIRMTSFDGRVRRRF